MCDQFVEFTSRCPSEECCNTKPIEWSCTSCSKRFLINSDAYIRCAGCKDAKPILITKSKFNCGEHHDNQAKPVNQLGIISFLCELKSRSAADKPWLEKLSKNIKRAIQEMEME